MRTFSKADRPCTDLSDGWCNVSNKDQVPGTVQMTVAYHKGQVVYEYRGDRNPQLGMSWRGAILNNPVKIIDHCKQGNGIPPEPNIISSGIPGLTFDKLNPGVYTTNCETDQTRLVTIADGKIADCLHPSLPQQIMSK